MKRLSISIIFLITLTLSTFAQRVDGQGLKMVSEIEYSQTSPTFREKFTFQYDENNQLVRMTVFHEKKRTDEEVARICSRLTPSEKKLFMESLNTGYVLYRDFIKSKDGLSVKDYDYFNFSPLTWDIESELDGTISRITYYEEFDRGSFKKVEYNFTYERDPINNTLWLSKYNDTEMGKHRGKTSWRGTSVGTLYSEFCYKDGFIAEGHADDIGRYYTIDYNHVNDTNINLLYFFGKSYLYGGGIYMEYFTIPDWLHCRSKYFADETIKWAKYKDNPYQANYKYDERGNLIEVEELINNRLDRMIKIKYVE